MDWGIVGAALVASAWGLLAWGTLKTWARVRKTPRDIGGSANSSKTAFVLGAAIGLLALFISSSMRYLSDIIWLGTLLAVLGFWYGLGFLRSRPLLKGLLSWTAFALIVLSISFGLLANFTNGDKRFEANNPALYSQIAHFFQRKP